MGVAGASAGVLSGVVVGLGSYALLTASEPHESPKTMTVPLMLLAIQDSRRAGVLGWAAERDTPIPRR